MNVALRSFPLWGPVGSVLLPVAALTLIGCVSDEHPLATSGVADFLFDKSPIFAADVLDDDGKPVLPRQSPFEKVVQLQLMNAGEGDHGAFVDVQLDPPVSLDLVPNGDDPSCRDFEGSFRCTAGEDGFASFIARSVSDFSGLAELALVGRSESDELLIHPAGLPDEASNFSLVIEGIDSSKIPARYNALTCTLDPQPDVAFDKWPEGAIRVREAEVRATPPSNAPSVVEHAPVIIETLHPEVFVTTDPECKPPRHSRLRVQLDELGRSPSFYFCFSDIGGQNMQLAFSSGVKTGDPRFVESEPEPRLLRIVNITTTVDPVQGPVEVVALSAFDADLNKVPMTVDITSDAPEVLVVSTPTAELPVEGEDARIIFATPIMAGTASILVAPELHSSPICQSQLITVLP